MRTLRETAEYAFIPYIILSRPEAAAVIWLRLCNVITSIVTHCIALHRIALHRIASHRIAICRRVRPTSRHSVRSIHRRPERRLDRPFWHEFGHRIAEALRRAPQMVRPLRLLVHPLGRLASEFGRRPLLRFLKSALRSPVGVRFFFTAVRCTDIRRIPRRKF